MGRFIKSNNKEQGTLYSVVTGNFVVFAFLVAFLTITVFLGTAFYINSMRSIDGPYKLIEQADTLKRERYGRLAIRGVLGRGSYIEILDSRANVIYCSNRLIHNTYRPEEIEYIQNVGGNSYYYVNTIYSDGEVVGYVIHKNTVGVPMMNLETGEISSSDSGVSGIMVLDRNRHVTYSTLDNGVTEISQTEFDYMYGGNEYSSSLQKYEFETYSGKKRTMIIHANYYNTDLDQEYKKILITAFLTFGFCLFVIILIFVFRIYFTIRKPLVILESAMNDITEGKTYTTVNYDGPKELVDIVNSFNVMSTELQDSEKKRVAAEQEKQKMLADISHDLKTPITVIEGYAKAVADGLIPENEEKKYLDTISKKAEGLSELINTFYEYSKLEHPEFSLVKKEGDVCEYFREYLAYRYEELELLGFELDLDIPDEEIRYSFDDMQLKRVFENILSNSIKANKAGTTIFASMKKEEGRIFIRLGDNGVGIPAELREKVFKPFVVGNESRTSGQGTGLGLSIAYLIIKAHGGNIRLLDETEAPGKTLFEIVL